MSKRRERRSGKEEDKRKKEGRRSV
jgi:hypothetical protein